MRGLLSQAWVMRPLGDRAAVSGLGDERLECIGLVVQWVHGRK